MPATRRRWALAMMVAACGACVFLAAGPAPHATAATRAPGVAARPPAAPAAALGLPGRAAAPPRPVAAPALPAQPGCGFFDISCHVGQAITSWFAGLVQSAVNPLFALLGRTLLATPSSAAWPPSGTCGRDRWRSPTPPMCCWCWPTGSW